MSTVTEAVDQALELFEENKRLKEERKEMLALLKKIATDNLPKSAPYWRRNRRSEARRLVEHDDNDRDIGGAP